MYNKVIFNYLDKSYEITNETHGVYDIMSGNTSNETFIVNSAGTFFEVSSGFSSSAQTNDNILISLYDSSTANIPINGLEDDSAYLNYYTTIKESGTTITTGNIPLEVFNNISNDYSYKIRNLKYAETRLNSFIDYINVSPFGEIIFAEEENNLLKLSAKSTNKYIDYSLIDITLYEISGATTHSTGFTFQSDNKYYNYELKPFLDNVFSPYSTPINIYNENSLCKNNYYIEELFDPTNDHRYSGTTWYPIQSSLYKIIPNDAHKSTLKHFKKYTYIDFGLLEKENNSIEYDYYNEGNLLQSSVTFEINKSPYIINDSGRTMIVDVNDEYLIIEKPFNDNSVSGLTGGTGTSSGITGIYDLINVAKTTEISDILLKVYLNIDSDYYHTKSDSERYNIYSAYGQILSENELIQNNTTGLIYNDENNHFNFDLFNIDDDKLSYNPLIVYGLGIDKKTMIPLNVDNINTLVSEDNWFLTSNISYQNDQHIIVHDSIVIGENELYSVIEFNDELTISGINLRLHFDSVTNFEILLKENHDYDTNLFWGDTTGSSYLQYTGMTVSALTAHTYQPGTYILTLDGKAEALDFKNNPYITEILSWSIPGVSSLKYISFENNINLKLLPYESGRLSGVTTFENAFKNTKIKNIPNGLFANNITAHNYSGTFYNCSQLKSLPTNLFNTTVTNISYCFYNCINLINTPSMTTLSNVIDASFAFKNCSKITDISGHIQGGPEVTLNYNSMFENCISLTTLTSNLFSHSMNHDIHMSFDKTFKNTAVNLTQSIFEFNGSLSYTTEYISTFENCNNITSIPTLFFDTCKSLNFNSTFKNCSSLTSVPSNIFSNNPDVTTFESTFENTKITIAPIFTNNTEVTTFKSTFKDCVSLISINQNMFNGCTYVTTFESTFKNTQISNMPSFSSNINVTSFESTFESSNIETIEPFTTNVLVTTFESSFKNNNIGKITVSPFMTNDKVITFKSTLEQNPLFSIPDIMFSGNTSVITYDSTFKDCLLTSINENLFYTTATTNEYTLIFNSTFENNRLNIIPDELFSNIIRAVDFRRTFKNNRLVYLPDLFHNNLYIEMLIETFMFNETLTGAAPRLWDYTHYQYVIMVDDCFSETGSLGTDGHNIPLSWGGKCSLSPLNCTGA